MASLQLKQTFVGKSGMQVYKAALLAIPNAGMQVWKTRELAQLVLGTGNYAGQEVRCNIIVSMVDGSATVTVEADALGDDQLEPLADKLMAELGLLLA